MVVFRCVSIPVCVLWSTVVPLCLAQVAPGEQKLVDKPVAAAAADPTPLPTPTMTGPLKGLPPATFDGGPLGKLEVTGILSGVGQWQGNHVPGDDPTQADLSNGQVFLQKTEGWLQFYIQAGAYDIPDLGVSFMASDKTLSEFWGPVPVAYLKLVPQKNTSILIGALPTLIGAESTFTFQNMNITRGLLWNQENAINRGIQLTQGFGKFTASFSWNDGFYSNRYSWLTGALTYTDGPHALTFVGGGNLGQTTYQTLRTPVHNNSQIYNVIYTYTKGSWIVQPYFQHTSIPKNEKIGAPQSASTQGGAVLLSYAFTKRFSLAGRWEYITSTGPVNLMFGPGSTGTSVTVTPTFQYGGLFFRGDFSWVHAGDYTPGYAFGSNGSNPNHPRAMAEIGFIFGNNVVERKP
jgi:hypothetical protein